SGFTEFHDVLLDNRGAVEVASGTLRLDGGANGTGGQFVVDPGAALDFYGSCVLDAGTSVRGAGTVRFGGTATVAASYDVTGETILAPPETNGSLRVSATYTGTLTHVGALTISGTADFETGQPI